MAILCLGWVLNPMLRAETLKEAKQNPSLSGITGREKEPKGFRAVPWGGGEGSQKPHRGAAGAGVWGLEPCRWPTSDVLSLLLGGPVTIKEPGLSSPEQQSRGIWGERAPPWGRESPETEWGRQPRSEKKRRWGDPGHGLREKRRDRDISQGRRSVPSRS